jgi:hypothetical protein
MDPFTIPPSFDNSCLSKIGEMPGDLWLALTKDVGKIADTYLSIPHNV